jgi:hypothetical protein
MAETKQQQQVPAAGGGVWKTVKPFVNGGASGMLATCVIQPIDMVKVSTSLRQRVPEVLLRELAWQRVRIVSLLSTGPCKNRAWVRMDFFLADDVIGRFYSRVW